MPVQLFGPVLTRVGGMPADVLDHLRLSGLAECEAELDAARAEAVALAGAVADLAYQAVPRATSPERRRALLRLRRDAHNGRATALAGEQLDGVRAELGEGAGVVDLWMAAGDRVRGAETALQDTVDRGRREVDAAVIRHAADPGFRRGVALASPTLFKELADGTGGDRRIRSAAAYLIRAACKPTPFSTLATLRLDHHDHDHRNGHGGATRAPRSEVSVVQALAHEVIRACAAHPDLAAAIPLAANPSARDGGDGRLDLLVPMYQHVDEEFFWRRDDVLDARHSASFIAAMSGLDRGARDDYLARLPLPAGELMTRLLDTCVLVPETPWPLDHGRPLAALAHTLGRVLSTPASAVADELGAMLAELDGFTEADGAERVRRGEAVRARATGLLTDRLDQVPPQWLGWRGLLYEQVRSGLPPVQVPEPVRADLCRLAGLVRPSMFRSHLYDEVRAHFLGRFGTGGTCDDLLGFAMGFTIGPDAISRFQRTALLDETRGGKARAATAPVASGPGTARPGALVMYQLAAEDADALRRGEHLFAINSVTAASLGMFARYRRLFSDTNLGAELTAWAKASYGDAEVLELPVALDVNGLQRDAAGVLRPVRWPTETTALGPDAVGLGELQLRHLADEDRLVFTFRNGAPVALAYTGVVPTTLISGPVRHLITITDPWALDFRSAERPSDAPVGPPPPTEVVAHPRQTDGRLVLGRAFWRLPAELFPRRAKGESRDAHLRRLDGWRRDHGMPDEVYVRVERARQGFSPNPKPLWLRFDAPPALAVLERVLADRALTVTVAEALPAVGEYWQRDAAGRRRVTEHVALLRWDD